MTQKKVCWRSYTNIPFHLMILILKFKLKSMAPKRQTLFKSLLFSVQLLLADYHLQKKLVRFQLKRQRMYKIHAQSCKFLDLAQQ